MPFSADFHISMLKIITTMNALVDDFALVHIQQIGVQRIQLLVTEVLVAFEDLEDIGGFGRYTHHGLATSALPHRSGL
jgi:hypothetical protein